MALLDTAKKLAQENTVTADQAPFDEAQSTEARVNRIASSGSPLVENATTQGTQIAAKRGLVNTSLAAGAAQKAVLEAATPIAQTDASLSAQTSLANLAARNAAKSQTAQQGATLGGQAMGLQNSNEQQAKALEQQQSQFNVNAGQNQQQINAQIEQFRQSLQQRASEFGTTAAQQQQQIDNQVAQFARDQQTKLTLAQLDADTRMKIANLQVSTQGNENLSQAWGTLMNTISSIQNNANLEEGAKRTLIQNNLDSFASFAAFWGKTSGVDVSELLDFGIAFANAPAPAPGAGAGAGGAVTDPNEYHTCFPAGSMVLMADMSQRDIATIQPGDSVWSPRGPVVIQHVETPLLGDRKLLAFDDGHRWSHEHAHWVLGGDGMQWWWAHDPFAWREEVANGSISGLRDNWSILSGPGYLFAHVQGWKHNEVLHTLNAPMDTQLYMPNPGNGAPIVVDGYLVGAGLDQWQYDYRLLKWEQVAPMQLDIVV